MIIVIQNIAEAALLLLTFVILCPQYDAKLVFRPPFHQPRIYETAPPGVHVTTVHAYDPDSPRKEVQYNLLTVTDHLYFALDRTSGNLTTNLTIDRKAGKLYEVMVVAVSQEETELKQLEIAVTEFNQFSPLFEESIYRAELHVNSSIGTAVLRVRAHDNDPVAHNAEIYYRMDQNISSKYFILDPKTGEMTLGLPLNVSEPLLLFGVFAEDGGSPKRWAHARVEVTVKTISEPEDLAAFNRTESTTDICWSRPQFGDVSGYTIKYRESGSRDSKTKILNMTSETPSGCSKLRDLKPMTEYESRIYGWNDEEIGQGSKLMKFSTKNNFCQTASCQNGGVCRSTSDEPGYYCSCEYGYYGFDCSKFDPCSLNPCDNFGNCHNTSHNEYVCKCLPGFSGVNCSHFDPCGIKPSPCLNGATCENDASHTYVCHCSFGYFGKTCQSRDHCLSNPCQNGGICVGSDAEFECKCPAGFTGQLCDEDVDECLDSPCKNGGICKNRLNDFECECLPGYSGLMCEKDSHCLSDTKITEKGLFYWNTTKQGIMVMLRCPYGSLDSDKSGFARRSCLLTSNGTAYWGDMDTQACKEEGFITAEELTDELRSITKDPRNMKPDSLRKVTDKIATIANYAPYDKKLAQDMLRIISNMMEVNDSVMEAGDLNGTTSNRLVKILSNFASRVPLAPGETFNLSVGNIAIKSVSISQVPAESSMESFKFTYNDNITSSQSESSTQMKNYQTAITVPVSIFRPPQPSFEMSQNGYRIKFIAYNNGKFFRSGSRDKASCSENSSSKDEQKTLFYKEDEYETISDRQVIQASVDDMSVSNLNEPVVYTIRTPFKKKVLCVFWKEQERAWSTDGISTNQTEDLTICTSSHLTAFSILLDPSPYLEISKEHRQALSIISYIGCALSIVGLSLTILTYSLFRCLNRDHSGKILLNLCISLLLLNISFLAGSLRSTKSGSGNLCVAVAILTHYFLLTSLSWMCVEAVNMYQLLIHVFASSETHFLLKRCLLAWGTPLVLVSITTGISLNEYRNQNDYCMLSPNNPYVYYISFLGPSCVILVINLTVFIMVSRVVFTPRMTSKAGCLRHGGSSHSVTASQIRGSFTVMVLLGVTWVFGTFAFGEAKVVFQYIFCIANSLQGFLIFLVRCLHYPEARSAWLYLLKTGTFKKYRGVLPPAGSWCTNSSSSNKQNGHTSTSRLRSDSSDATGTVVFNSNFWGKVDRRGSSTSYGSQQPLASGRLTASIAMGNLLKSINLQKDSSQKGMSKELRTASSSPPADIPRKGKETGERSSAQEEELQGLREVHPTDRNYFSEKTDP